MNSTEMTLYDADGRRKYLVESEFKAFLAAAETLPPRERAYCHTLAHTGGRLAEIIALRKQDIDLKAGSIRRVPRARAACIQSAMGSEPHVGRSARGAEYVLIRLATP